MNFRKLRTCGALVLLSALAWTDPASAVSAEELAASRAAAREGLTAYNNKDYARALDLMQRAEKLRHAPPHLLYIARAYEKLGRLVAARETYLKLRNEQLSASAPGSHRAAQNEGAKELKALGPRLPYVTVTVEGGGDAKVVLKRDGKAIPSALIGISHPVDPGAHTFIAEAPNLRSQPAQVNLAEGAREQITLTLQSAPGAGMTETPEPTKDPAGAADPNAIPDTPPPGGGDSSSDASSSGTSPMRIGAYAALGVGAVGLGTGLFFHFRSNSKKSEADDLVAGCPENDGRPACSEDVQSDVKLLDRQSAGSRTISTVGFIAGGVGVAAGVTLLIMDMNSDKSANNGPRVAPFIGYRSVGIVGQF